MKNCDTFGEYKIVTIAVLTYWLKEILVINVIYVGMILILSTKAIQSEVYFPYQYEVNEHQFNQLKEIALPNENNYNPNKLTIIFQYMTKFEFLNLNI